MPDADLVTRPSERVEGDIPIIHEHLEPLGPLPPDPEWGLAAGAPLVVEISGDLKAIEQEWKSFASRADCTAFQAIEWLAKWQQQSAP